MATGTILLLLGVLVVGGSAAIRAFRNRRRLHSKVEDAVDRHLDKLVRLRAELLSYGDNGELCSREWDYEIERFIGSQVAEGVTSAEAKVLERHRAEMTCLIAARVARAAASPVWYQS